jgi:hypothetical protein
MDAGHVPSPVPVEAANLNVNVSKYLCAKIEPSDSRPPVRWTMVQVGSHRLSFEWNFFLGPAQVFGGQLAVEPSVTQVVSPQVSH